MKKTQPLPQSMQVRLIPREHPGIYLHCSAEILCPQGVGATQKGKTVVMRSCWPWKGWTQMVAASSVSASSFSTPSLWKKVWWWATSLSTLLLSQLERSLSCWLLFCPFVGLVHKQETQNRHGERQQNGRLTVMAISDKSYIIVLTEERWGTGESTPLFSHLSKNAFTCPSSRKEATLLGNPT